MIGTFVGVLFFTMLKEAFEDYQRYKSDRELNNKQTFVYDPENDKLIETKWENIKVGEIVKVIKD